MSKSKQTSKRKVDIATKPEVTKPLQPNEGPSAGPTTGKSPKKPDFFQRFLYTLMIVALISLGVSNLLDRPTEDFLTLSQVAAEIQNGTIDTITVRGNILHIELFEVDPVTNEPLTKESKKESEAALTETLVNYGVAPAALAQVEIDVQNESGLGYWIGRVLPLLIPLLFLAILVWFVLGQVRGAGMKAFSFGQSKARVVQPKDQKVRFKDVAGNIEAKQELAEVVEFLKFPKKFFAIGAKIPKGVLLMGAPGTGKTLMARAVAGEAGVPFFHLSGSEFVEMFVGIGASRVRDLFAMAKKAAPAIIFIDEIDAVGRSRGVGMGGGNDEREQTLNQILVEMDGFEPTQKVIVIAATNRMDVLDTALLRPGRFDRRVMLDLPDRKDRLAILQIHANEKPLAEDVRLEVVAQRTPGFSGADLESLMNEAAITAARQDKKEINQVDIVDSIDKVLIGPERKSHLHTPKDREVTAYHEAGHAIVASAMPGSDPVRKVSIVARGHAGGYTLKLSDEESNLRNREDYINDITMTLGGYVTEKIVFGDITTGPANDLQVATKTAHSMVNRWGMSDVIGPMALSGTKKTLFGDNTEGLDMGNTLVNTAAGEVQKILHTAEEKAHSVITEYRSALEAVAKKLLAVETLEQEEYEAIIAEHGIILAKKKS